MVRTGGRVCEPVRVGRYVWWSLSAAGLEPMVQPGGVDRATAGQPGGRPQP